MYKKKFSDLAFFFNNKKKYIKYYFVTGNSTLFSSSTRLFPKTMVFCLCQKKLQYMFMSTVIAVILFYFFVFCVCCPLFAYAVFLVEFITVLCFIG